MHKKILKIIITFILSGAITFVSYAANVNEAETNMINITKNNNTNLDELKQKKDEIQNKMTESQESLQGVENELTENLKQVQKMDETISENQKTLDEINSNISKMETLIKKIEKELKNVTAKYKKQKRLLDQRLIAMYEMKETSYLDIVLTSANLSDFLSTYYLVTELTKYDVDLLDVVERQKKEIETNQEQIVNQKKMLEEQKQKQVKTQVVLENSKLIRQNYIAKLTEEEQKIQSQIDDYNLQVNVIENEIKELLQTASFGEEYIGGKMIWPIDGHYNITSPFAMRIHPITKVYKLHTGIDISAAMGTNFLAAAYGIVVKAEYNRAYGNMVIVDHGGGVQTLYAHGSSIEVSLGQVVNAGDTVIKVGSTGYSTGPHAHFEIRINGQPVNPLDHLSIPNTEEN